MQNLTGNYFYYAVGLMRKTIEIDLNLINEKVSIKETIKVPTLGYDQKLCSFTPFYVLM